MCHLQRDSEGSAWPRSRAAFPFPLLNARAPQKIVPVDIPIQPLKSTKMGGEFTFPKMVPCVWCFFLRKACPGRFDGVGQMTVNNRWVSLVDYGSQPGLFQESPSMFHQNQKGHQKGHQKGCKVVLLYPSNPGQFRIQTQMGRVPGPARERGKRAASCRNTSY